MRMRKRKWVTPYLEKEDQYLVRDATQKGSWLDNTAYDVICLEIGMGMGDFLTETASLFPTTLFIGLEKNETCVAKAIRKAEEKKIKNLKIIKADAKELPAYFAKGEVKCLYLNFSDPWPKKAHWKRRLTYKDFLTVYREILSDDGELRLKTDNSDLFEFSLLSCTQEKWQLRDISVDYHRIKREEACTAYEKKFMAEGNPIYFALFQK